MGGRVFAPNADRIYTATEAKIPMLDLHAQHAELDEELFEEFSAVHASGRFVLGEPVEAFESDLAKLRGVLPRFWDFLSPRRTYIAMLRK